jgi:hypothetical protein
MLIDCPYEGVSDVLAMMWKCGWLDMFDEDDK